MALNRHQMLRLRPSKMLGFLLYAWPILFVLFIIWHCWFGPFSMFGKSIDKLRLSNWIVLVGVVFAVEGWMVSAYITLRNSIKQHTINTLLQSRLSAVYMESARIINESFFAPGMNDEPISVTFIRSSFNVKERGAVDYVLNYFEFLAVGIRHGDLDKNVLGHTLRGILVRLYGKMILYIKFMRDDDGIKVGNPAQLEHLTWLYESWIEEIRKEKINLAEYEKKAEARARQMKFYDDMINS